MSKPTVYLTGAGPGDSKLITVRALELIKNADCIIYDYLLNPQLLKFADKKCKLIYVGKKAGAHTLSQDKINQLLLKQARTHKVVVRLKGGDPFVFGRGAEEALYLKNKGVNFEVVPGISSAIAVPSYAGIPLTARNKNSTVGFITGHEDPTKKQSNIDWSALTKALGTMVFLMGVKNLSLITKKLINCGKPKTTPVSVIRWGTTSAQQTITGNLGNIMRLAKVKAIAPPAIIVVGEVAGLRKQLNWFEKRPLFGRKIIVTRTREQASALSDALLNLGAQPIEVPTIKIVPLKADKQLRSALLHNSYDWVFFTSQNGVEEFSRILNRAGKDCRIIGNAKVCAIGTETAKALAKIGIRTDYVPVKFYAEEAIKYFKNKKLKNTKALILRASKARDVLPGGLRKLGADVKIINLYDIGMPKNGASALKQALSNGAGMATFTSSSTVENFIKLLGSNYKGLLKNIKIASIGPVTSKTAKRLGLRVDIEAKVYTIKGLVEAIVKHD